MRDDGYRNIDVPGWPQAVRIEWERETLSDPYSSPNEYLFQDAGFREADQARMDAWLAGEWELIGIRARATVYVPAEGVSFAVYEMESPGVWGVESDAGEELLSELFEEEKAQVIDAIRAMGAAVGEED